MLAHDQAEIRLVHGSIWLSAACYECYFGGAHSIILLYDAESQHFWLLPVRAERAGGFLLKLVNLRGDRVANVHGFFRDHDISEDLEAAFTPRWDSARQGLVIDLSQKARYD